jgi:hypothetical protein
MIKRKGKSNRGRLWVTWTSGSEKNNRICRMFHKKEFSKRGQKRIQGAVERISRPKI